MPVFIPPDILRQIRNYAEEDYPTETCGILMGPKNEKDKVSEIQPAGDRGEKIGILEDIISALINLGYKRNEIDERISQLEEVTSKEKDIEKALKESLKIMRRV